MNTEEAIMQLERCGKKFSDEQLAILRTSGGIDLLAVAGSGKTFTMSNLIAKRMLTGEINDSRRVLCTTFSKAGVDELDTRLNLLLQRLGLPRVDVTTIHAACYEILRQFGFRASKVLGEGEALKLLREAAKEYGYGRMSQDDLMNLMNTISIQYNSLMTDAQLVNSDKWVLDMDTITYVNIREKFQTMKGNMGAIDFDDMQRFVYDWLCSHKSDPNYDGIAQWCRNRWRWLFIDEFQDTNPVQLAIITAILGDDAPSERLVVVGDDDQCIYEWRGTDPRILINICGNFDLSKRYLSTNYRCPNTIVELAGNCVVNMGERETKTMAANRQGGSVNVIDITDMYKETHEFDENGEEVQNRIVWKNPICKGSQAVADRVYDMISGKDGLCGEKAACVLSRNNATMRILANMLYSIGIPVKGQANMYISRSREWGTFKRLLKISSQQELITDVSDILWQIIPSASIGFGNIISSVIVEAGCSIDWALERVLNACYRDKVYLFVSSRQLIAGDSAKKGNGTISVKTISSAEYEIGRGIKADDLVEIINALRTDDCAETVMRLIVQWKIASAFMYKTNSQRRMFEAYIEYFTVLVKRYGYDGVQQYVRTTEQFEEGRYDGDKRVELRTIHGAKGGEWDTVFILMDDNIEFPSLEAINLMQVRDMDREVIRRYIDSERRLHYVAQTRASRRLYLVSEIKFISVFALESVKSGGGNDNIYERAGALRFSNNQSEIGAIQSLVE